MAFFGGFNQNMQQIDCLRMEIVRLNEIIKQQNVNLVVLQNQNAGKEETIKRFRKSLDDSHRSQRQLTTELDQFKRQVADLENIMMHNITQIAELNKKLSDYENAEKNAIKADMKKELRDKSDQKSSDAENAEEKEKLLQVILLNLNKCNEVVKKCFQAID